MYCHSSYMNMLHEYIVHLSNGSRFVHVHEMYIYDTLDHKSIGSGQVELAAENQRVHFSPLPARKPVSLVNTFFFFFF